MWSRAFAGPICSEMPWIPPGMSRSRVAALIAAPVIVLFVVGVAVMTFAALLIMGAASAHQFIGGVSLLVVSATAQ